MSPESERVFVDTNILIYSTFEDFEPEKYVHCTDILDKLQKSGTTLFISSQILREFFAISTNQNIFKKPLTYKQAVTKMKEFIARFTIVHEKESTIDALIALIGKYAVSRQQIHDMNIVATMVDNEINRLLTYNVKDFKQISEIELLL
jgi:predicted nucleic acid-binding protein